MSKTTIVNKATRTFHRVGLKLRKHSPEILVVGGVVGTVTGAVMACKATTKASAILEEAKKDIEIIETVASDPAQQEGGYTEEDHKKDLTIVYAQTGVKLAKTYAPAIIVGGLSIAAILTGHNIMRKRYITTAAAYAAVDKGFKQYRDRVVERFGEELDRELRYNLKTKKVEEIEIDAKGKEKKVEKAVEVIDPAAVGDYSPYARFFDDGCVGWDKDPQASLLFLTAQQSYANDKLQSQGFLFLNDVYEMLGIPKTSIGQRVGWIYDENCPNGDNYVDFGIFVTNREKNRDFVNGYERVILLDFNVDGNIIDLI